MHRKTKRGDQGNQGNQCNQEIYEKNDVCIICLDDNIRGRPMKLSEAIYQLNFYSICSCSCDVHTACMKEWSDVSPKCPICRIPLRKYKTILYWLTQPSFNNRRRQLNRENVKTILTIVTIPVCMGLHILVFYILSCVVTQIICQAIFYI